MSGSPWFGVLAIGGACAGILLLQMDFAGRKGLHNSLARWLRVPLQIGLLLSGIAACVLLLATSLIPPEAPIYLVGLALLGYSGDLRPRWFGLMMWLDGAVLVAAKTWLSWPDGELFGRLGPTLVALIPPAFWLLVVGYTLYRLLRPRTDQPLSTPTTETGTPA